MRRYVTAVLTALPFEQAWYESRGVRTHYVGHPYFDELAEHVLDGEFVAAQGRKPGPLVTLLFGSRTQEVTANGPLIVAAAAKVLARVAGARFAVAAFNEKQAQLARGMLSGTGLPAEVCVGRTPELIAAAACCVAVSGSVGLELMVRLKPTVVVYKIAPVARLISRPFIVCPYISLVNLLAGAEVFPEYLTTGDCSAEVAGHVAGWLTDDGSRRAAVARLEALRGVAAVPGACDRAAAFLATELAGRGQDRP